MYIKSASSLNSLPKISIITVVRNGMPFVEQTVDSVLGQSYSNLEYIVIDGGSTDGTVDIIKFHEVGIIKWLSEKDEGIADAFNKGLSFATGDYILFLNADDMLATPDVLVELVEKIIQYEYPAMIYGDFNILKRDTADFLYQGMIELSHKGMMYGQVLPHPCLLTHRAYFEKYGSFDTSYRIAMDYEWFLRGGFVEKIVHVPLLVSNIRDGGISTKDHGKAVNEIIAALKKNNLIRSALGEYKIRGYFFIRLMARRLLNSLGLYKRFFALRNKLKI